MDNCSYPKFRIIKANPSRTAGTSRRTSAGLFAEARPPAFPFLFQLSTFMGDCVAVTYTGSIMESYPGQIEKVTKLQLLDDEK